MQQVVDKTPTLQWESVLRWGSAAIALGILIYQIPTLVEVASRGGNGYFATDYGIYMDATRRWLETGSFYYPHQLAGPYPIVLGDVLYPPVALWLFVPFTVLPAILWWVIPIGISSWVIWRLQPGPLSWPLMAAILGWGPVQIHLISGNPDLWACAFVALGTLYRWPAVFVLLKPTIAIAPFALWGIRDRSWWIALLAFAALSLPFLPMWFDWLKVVLNSRGGGLLYSWQEAPLLLLPIFAWLARPGGRYDIHRR